MSESISGGIGEVNGMSQIKGLVFDIEEFAVFDGPGIRTTVFLKGCPLRCNWCHNPEGLLMKPQRVVSSMCVGCGACRTVCPSPDNCIGCGKCLDLCPRNCIRMAGRYWTAEELAAKLAENADILEMNGGGITFSGGECTLQADFVLEVRRLLPHSHFAIETCGYCPTDKFKNLISEIDLVMFDIKHTDPGMHKRYTGVDNQLIFQNLNILIESGVPFIARVPVIPGVNDSVENLTQTACWLKDAKNLICVELLSYNMSAGAKYKGVGMKYQPDFDESQKPRLRRECFEQFGIKVKIM